MTTTNRTLQFFGLAYGNSDVTITATIDNVIVYNNTVATLNEAMIDPGTNWTTTNQLFTVENSDLFPTDFAGSRVMSVTVTGGKGIFLTQVLSNYIVTQYTQVGNILKGTPGDATTFVNCYNGTPTNSDGSLDCRSSVVINGETVAPHIDPPGVWTWTVYNGSTLVCNLNVSLGNVAV